MKVIRTEIPEVVILEPPLFEDARGHAFESFNRRTFREATGVELIVAQENLSRSRKNVVRGIHYQIVQPQGKLIAALSGEVFDVAVDLRRSSPTFKQWVGAVLSAGNRRRLWVPPGFGHAFLVLSETADVLYQLSDFWAPEHERSILWNDPSLAIAWPAHGEVILSERDRKAFPFAEAELYP